MMVSKSDVRDAIVDATVTKDGAEVTDDQIEQLKTEAVRAGDAEQVRICDRALRGHAQAREECERVIRDAQAQED